jgi:hypothetical protein
VPKQPLAVAATAVICLLITTGAGLAQQRYYPQQRYSPQMSATSQGSYQYQSPVPVAGTYKSDAFYPSPLVLNITGIDSAGNLSGSMWGMETKPQNGEDPAWQYWQRVFGRDARGTYRGGRVNITFSNGANYTLDVRGNNELSGTFATKTSNYPVSFLRSSGGVAAR